MSYVRPIDNSRLICKLIRSKPELYSPEHPDYSNRPLHSKVWKELAGKLGVSVGEFRSKWASMRNSYARCIKAKQEHPNRTRVKWYLEDHMDFLEKHILHRAKRRNFIEHFANATVDDLNLELGDDTKVQDHSIKSDIENDEETRSVAESRKQNGNVVNGGEQSTHSRNANNNSRLDELDEIFKHDERHSNSAKEHSKQRRHQHDERSVSPEMDRLISSVTNFFESQAVQLKSNPDDLFFQSIEKDYDKLTDKKKRKFKLTVLNALNDLLDEAE